LKSYAWFPTKILSKTQALIFSKTFRCFCGGILPEEMVFLPKNLIIAKVLHGSNNSETKQKLLQEKGQKQLHVQTLAYFNSVNECSTFLLLTEEFMKSWFRLVKKQNSYSKL
jgi:hypothetical protein